MNTAVSELRNETDVAFQVESDQPETILVVDDSLVDARLAAAIIRNHFGLRVLFAKDGLQALEILELERPAAVVTDLLMPRLDGLELVHEVCKRLPHTPVIL